MDEDVDDTPKNNTPLANTGRWTTTSTYDVYMVDTTKNPSRRWRRRTEGTNRGPSGHNIAPTNNRAAAHEADSRREDIQAFLEQQNSPAGIPEDEDPDDLFDGADNNYLPKSKEDKSLRTEDYVVPKDPFEQE